MSSASSHDSLDKSTPGGNVARLINRLSKDINSQQAMSVPVKRDVGKVLAKVRYSYDAAQDDELTLCENDIIEFLEDVEDGWARGKLNGKIGLFPTNFVTFPAVPSQNRATYTNAINENSLNERPQQIKREESDKSRPKSIQKPPTDTIRSSSSATKLNSSGSSSPGLKEYGKVLYDYNAEHPDELELKEGEIIVVLNKKTADEGWYEGELNGRKGVFPENFVRLMSSSEKYAEATNTTPPSLPAKPTKPVVSAKPSNGDAPQKSPVQPSASNGNGLPTKPSDLIRERQSTIQSENKAPESTSTSSSTSTVKSSLEERKSVIAGLQSKLFPQGKLPPHRPAFTSHSNAMTSSVHGPLKEEREAIPGLRHSIMDPTRISPEKNEEDSVNESKAGQLEALTKARPKMNGKRPPSNQFRQSKLSLPFDSNPPESEEPKDLPTTPVESTAFSSGPATTVFPAGPEKPSPIRQASPVNKKQEVQGLLKDMETFQQNFTDNASAKLSKEPVTAVEFDQFRQDVFARLQCLEEKVDRLLRQEKL
ncbi:unnamed protein product [Bursaphelenchus okinawaensis]|uniref:SH3 domain-containing protein n=1 Tax=Bursaphelenchus okinawaensis TaxID=465554 RepID=A0A811JQD6_9BILA|nr:unnamed protein product [Bursaphelenchus okinawaensis]CAG9078026.1 unnamed protein product [Bursaphelenchus okinawaensis]